MELKNNDFCPTTEWRFALPESFGIDSQMLLRADNFIKSKLKSVNSFIIVKNGYIIFERYYNNYDFNTVSHIASITKSILSALIGIAIKVGYIKNLNQKVMDFFPEIKFSKNLYNVRCITLHNLLTMTSGIAYNDISIINKNPNWIDYILGLTSNKIPGNFLYNDLNAHLLSIILTKLTRMSTQDFTNKYLFSNMGIDVFNSSNKFSTDPFTTENSKWWTDSQGYNTGGWGLSLNSRDLAKLGYLYLNNGIWDGYELIPYNWVTLSTKEHVQLSYQNNVETGYGYLWWICNNMGQHIYFARGRREQYIINCPQLDMITVFKTQEDSLSNINLFKFWRLYVFPGCI